MSIKERTFVSSHGYSSASVFLLGGIPLKEDINKSLALSGTSQTTLQSFLKPAGLDINMCYRAVFIKEEPPYMGTNSARLHRALIDMPTKEYEQMLLQEIREINPNVIVTLDDISLGAVFPHILKMKKPRGRKHWTFCYRGSVLPLRADWQLQLPKPMKVIPTLGPQLLYADNSARSYIALDFEKIKRYSESTESYTEYGLYWTAKDAGAFQTFLERHYWLVAEKDRPRLVTFDVETFGGLLRCISFTFDGYEGCTVPLYDPSIPRSEMLLLWKLVAWVLANPLLEKNNQNIKYDWKILERHGFYVSNVRQDTMLKTGLIYSELPKGLDFLTSIYTPIPYYKDEGKEFDSRIHDFERLYNYCAKDSVSAHIITKEQDKELEEIGSLQLYNEEVAPSILIYRNMDECGLRVDFERRAQLLEKYEGLTESNLASLRMLTHADFNPRSNPDVGKVVYEELKYPVRRKTDPETGKSAYKCDKETLEELLIMYGSDTASGKIGAAILNRIIVCRKLFKIKEYILTELHPNGYLRAESKISGTETGRSSSSTTIDERHKQDEEYKKGNAKNFIKLGRSLQTISKHGFTVDEDTFDDWESRIIAADLRSMFVPPKDFFFFEGDGNSAEARVVFVLAEDYEGLADCDRKPKKHAKTAAFLYDIDVNSITKDSPVIPQLGIAYYDMGKKVRHAGNYAMGAFRLAQMTHIPLKECERLIARFNEKEPAIRGTFHAEVRRVLQNARKIVNPFGRVRQFFSRLDEGVYKEGYATFPQGTVSDLTKFTMHRIADDLPGYMKLYYFLNENHDGILSLVHKDYWEPYAKCFKKHYERKINFNYGSFIRDFELTIPAELSKSDTTWEDISKPENEVLL